MVMPSEPLRDKMRRTLANLAFVERHAEPDGPFEVTQLINSFLGALAHPWEVLQVELKGLTLVEARRLGWPVIYKELSSDREPASLGDLVRLMRNSFAHGNISFLSGSGGEIRALRIWNSQGSQRTWGAIVTVEDARAFLIRFSHLAEELHTKNTLRAPRSA